MISLKIKNWLKCWIDHKLCMKNIYIQVFWRIDFRAEGVLNNIQTILRAQSMDRTHCVVQIRNISWRTCFWEKGLIYAESEKQPESYLLIKIIYEISFLSLVISIKMEQIVFFPFFFLSFFSFPFLFWHIFFIRHHKSIWQSVGGMGKVEL